MTNLYYLTEIRHHVDGDCIFESSYMDKRHTKRSPLNFSSERSIFVAVSLSFGNFGLIQTLEHNIRPSYNQRNIYI